MSGEDKPAAPDKLDAETLVLRGAPPRAARFRRGVIVTVAAATSLAIAGVTWVALQPAALKLAADSRSDGPRSTAAPDALAGAPKSYGEVPKLGPPLPGDLGRPILEHQKAMGTETPVVARGNQAAETERQRIAAERKAARESALLVQGARPAAPPADPTIAAPPAAETGQAPTRKEAFLGGRSDDVAASPHRLQPAASPWTLSAGSVIAASLLTGLSSDLPGLVTAQITENVYDSATGRILLLPQGARLIGRYDSVVAFGQKRALVAWQRIVLPNGASLALDNLPATDAAGYAGLEDKVDFHSWQLLKGIGMATVLGVGTELSLGGESDLVEALRESAQQSAGRAGEQITARNLNVQPTITVRPGWPVRVLIAKDLILQPWKG
jgi:type IV secretion system protein TrbI